MLPIFFKNHAVEERMACNALRRRENLPKNLKLYVWQNGRDAQFSPMDGGNFKEGLKMNIILSSFLLLANSIQTRGRTSVVGGRRGRGKNLRFKSGA